MKEKGFVQIVVIAIIGILILTVGVVTYFRFLRPAELTSNNNQLITSKTQPVIVWKYQMPPLTGSSCGSKDKPYNTQKYIVIQTKEKEVVAIDKTTGKESWSFTVPEAVCFAVLTVLKDKVVLSGNASATTPILYTLDLETGKQIWNKSNTGLFLASSESNIYLLYDAYIYSLDTSNGKETWRIEAKALDPEGINSVIGYSFYNENFLYFGIKNSKGSSYYFSIDTLNRQLKWKIPFEYHTYGNDKPIVEDGKIYMKLDNCETDLCFTINEFDLNSGKKLWDTKASANNFIVENGTLYKMESSNINNSLEAINLATKNSIWTYKGTIIKKIHLDKNVLYADDDGKLVAIDTNNGKKIWSTEGGQPIYTFENAIYTSEFKTLGLDSYATFIHKVDKEGKHLWRFPDHLSSKIIGSGDLVYFIAYSNLEKNNDTYLYAVK